MDQTEKRSDSMNNYAKRFYEYSKIPNIESDDSMYIEYLELLSEYSEYNETNRKYKKIIETLIAKIDNSGNVKPVVLAPVAPVAPILNTECVCCFEPINIQHCAYLDCCKNGIDLICLNKYLLNKTGPLTVHGDTFMRDKHIKCWHCNTQTDSLRIINNGKRVRLATIKATGLTFKRK